ncbi:hypothetical protein MMC32_008149 [Xylographa parallela]|nr:hypothetical protein [Xylographa parallela]
MYLNLLFVALAASVVPSLAAPTRALEPRGASQCGQYTSISTGSYTIYANEWGSSTGTGSQCSQINGLTGSTLAWSTSWSWSGGPNNVKSYTNVEAPMTSKPLSQYNSIKTNWTWSYTGTNIVANVAYDTFLGSSATSAQAYEVMVWLGDFGGCSPLSNNGYPPTPVATPTIGNVAWNLILGQNGNVVVYSFVAQSKDDTSFSGDLLLFYKYLETNYKLSSGEYLQSIQAGSEVFTGSNAVLTTSAYSIVVS